MPLSASALRAAFRRSGANGTHTGELETAPPDVLASIRAALRDGDCGQAVLVSWESVGRWVALTPGELLICDGGRAERHAVAEIQEVTAVRRREKASMTEIDVRLVTGDSLRIRTDPGPPFAGMLSALLALARSV